MFSVDCTHTGHNVSIIAEDKCNPEEKTGRLLEWFLSSLQVTLQFIFFSQFTVLCEAKYLIMKPVTPNVHLEVSFALGYFTCAREVHWITKGSPKCCQLVRLKAGNL